MNRSLKLSMLMALALGTSQAIALDLGQIQVKSALGQPLLAEIPVHPASPAELQNLTVQLASSEEFARAGIVGGRTIIPLRFSVANAAGGKVIRITSSEAVQDPYLDLLLEVNSNAGRSVREFAILLDPPSAAAAPAPVAAAPTRRLATPARPAQTRQSAAPRAAAAPTAAPAVSNGQYGPVERGQTLSSIARSAAPAGVNAQQMMLALKQANPDAFYRDNINALKSGAILRVPTSAEAQAMTIAAAMAEVRRQNSDWRAGTPGQPAVVADTATRASASSAPSNTGAGAGDRLALVQAKDSKNAGGPGNSAAGRDDKMAASLRQELLRNQESLASLQQQGSELKTRLKDMADINSKNEHLLSLKDSEIADLQAKLAAARKAAGSAPAAAEVKPTPSPAANAPKPALTESHMETATASTVASPTPAGAPSSAVVTTALASASTAPSTSMSAAHAAAAAPAPVKPAAKPVTKPVAAPAVEQPWYMQTWAWGAGVAAIALLLLLALLGRRRKPATAAASPKAAPSLADRFGSTAAEQDLIGGEDVDQEELLDQLAEHPDDIGLHLELVTLYYSRRDVEHFEAAAEAMHAHITDPQQDEWQDVMHMGEDLVPGHPLFDHHAELPLAGDAEAHREFDIDDYADEADAPTVVSTMPPLPTGAPKKVSEYNFNFDLTRPAGTESSQPSPAADDATVVAPVAAVAEAKLPETSWHFDDAESAHPVDGLDVEEFNDDPIDTKLDLARAYLDMGDADGARAMLGEVMKEGSQMQRDTAKRLLDNLH